MKWRVERCDSATVLIVESNLGTFARMITDSEFKTAHDQGWLFWMAVLDLKFACLGHSKSQADVYELLDGLNSIGRAKP